MSTRWTALFLISSAICAQSTMAMVETGDVAPSQKEQSRTNEKRYSDRGSIELGGAMAFSNASQGSYSQSILEIAPVVNFFPAPRFLLGPIVTFAGDWMGSYFQDQIGLGTRIGFTIPMDESRFYYMSSGIEWDVVSASSGYSGGGSQSREGFSIPIVLGWKIALQKHVSINIEPSVRFQTINNQTLTVFSIGYGITGLIF